MDKSFLLLFFKKEDLPYATIGANLSPVKIVHVVRQFTPSVGGLEDCVVNLCHAQQTHLGLSPSVVTLDRLFTRPDELLPAQEIVDGIPTVRIPWRGSKRYPIAPSVLQFLGDADLVHVHAIDFFFDFLALTRPVHRKRLIASTHGGFFHTKFASNLKKIYFNSVTRLSARAYDRIVACSQHDAEMFERVAAKNLVTIENGANLAKFGDAAAKDHRRVMISFGRMAHHKRLDGLLPLLRELRRSGEDWKLIIAGAAGEVTPASLRDAAAALGVAEAFELVVGPTEAELRTLIGKASYFISPSEYEGFGIAAVEALSAGLVPLLSGIPPFVRLLSRATDGLVIDVDTPAIAARAISQHALGLTAHWPAARDRVRAVAEDYDWRIVAARYNELYQGRRLLEPAAVPA